MRRANGYLVPLLPARKLVRWWGGGGGWLCAVMCVSHSHLHPSMEENLLRGYSSTMYVSTRLPAYGNILELVRHHMKKQRFEHGGLRINSSLHYPSQRNSPVPTQAKSRPLPGCAAASTCRNGIRSSCSRYLQPGLARRCTNLEASS